MEQCTLVNLRHGILNHQRAGRKRGRQIGLAQGTCGNPARAREVGPNRRQMAFARTFRADHRKCPVGPVRPALDETKRVHV